MWRRESNSRPRCSAPKDVSSHGCICHKAGAVDGAGGSTRSSAAAVGGCPAALGGSRHILCLAILLLRLLRDGRLLLAGSLALLLLARLNRRRLRLAR